MTFTFELVTPEKLLFSKEVEMVVVPGTEGDFGVLKGHAPLISTLRTGVVEIHAPEEPVKRFCVSGGFTEVTAGRCTVLATDSIDLGELTKEYVEQKLFSAGTDEEKQAVIREIHAAQSMMSSSKQH